MEQVARLPTRKESALKPLYVMIRDIRQLDHGSTSEAAAALSNIDGYTDELSGRLYGDPEGHSEASHRGWEERGGLRSRYRDDDGRFTSSRSRYALLVFPNSREYPATSAARSAARRRVVVIRRGIRLGAGRG